MNLIFSFDSVLSALAITDVFPVLAIAIVLSGLAMLLLADGVTSFLEKNRMYEVLGLFILLIVGVVLLGEAGVAAAHAVHDDTLNIKVFGQDIIPMSKSTFYFFCRRPVRCGNPAIGLQPKVERRAQSATEALVNLSKNAYC